MLETLPLEENSDDFVFDNEMLAQTVAFGFRIGEVSCPTKYFEEASSINFSRSVRYGFGVLGTAGKFLLQRSGLVKFRLFSPEGRRLAPDGGTATDRQVRAPPGSRPVSARLFANLDRKAYIIPLTNTRRVV